MVAQLADQPQWMEAFYETGVFERVYDVAMQYANSDPMEVNRLAAMNLLTELWLRMPTYMDLKEDYQEEFLDLLRSFSHHHAPTVQLAVCSFLFMLLDMLIPAKNRFAPFVYKTLVFASIANDERPDVRNYLFKSLGSLFQRHPTVYP